MRIAPVAGIATARRRAGTAGPEVVLLHGFGADASVWLMTEPALAARARLLLADLPGHGASAADLPPGGLDGFAAHAGALLEAEGLGRAWLIGHSFGAAVALALAAAAPDRVAGLVLVAPVGLAPLRDAGLLRELAGAEDVAAIKAVLGRMVARPAMVTPAMARGVAARLAEPGRRAAWQALAALIPEVHAELAPRLERLPAVPVLVLRGAADPLVQAEAPLPGPLAAAEAHVLPGTAHLPQMEAPARVNALIGAFLDRHA